MTALATPADVTPSPAVPAVSAVPCGWGECPEGVTASWRVWCDVNDRRSHEVVDLEVCAGCRPSAVAELAATVGFRVGEVACEPMTADDHARHAVTAGAR